MKRLTELAIAYAKGQVSWPPIADETGVSYGELLIELGLNNLQIPRVTPEKSLQQMAFFDEILDQAARAKSADKG